MTNHRTPRTAPSVRLAAITVAGIVLLASCAAAPDEAQVGARSADSEQEALRERPRSGNRWRYRRWRDRETTTTTTTPVAPETPPRTPNVVTPPTVTTPTVTTPPAVGGSNPTPNGPSGAWNLRFADEFNGSSLDLSKWRPNWLAGSDTARTPPVNAYEQSCYDPAQVSVSGGSLHLTAERITSSRSGCVLRNGSSASYASGLIQSDEHFEFTYGYAEARMYLPGNGNNPENWPAFWTNGQSWPRDGEIDIMEVLGGEPRWHYHASGIDQGSGFDLINPKTGWHTFGALWEPGKITFYYDGREVGSTTRGVVSTRHYIIVNHALSTTISGPIVTPSTLQVDYVRVWQR